MIYDREKEIYSWEGGGGDSKISVLVQNTNFLELELGYDTNDGREAFEDVEVSVSYNGKETICPLSSFREYEDHYIRELRFDGKSGIEYIAGILIFIFGFCITFFIWPQLHDSFKNTGIYIFLFSAAVKKYYGIFAYGAYTYIESGDSPDYIINSLSELSWSFRMPVYQIFILLIRKLSVIKAFGDDTLFSTVACIQIFLGTLSCVLFYAAVKKVTRREWLAVAAALVYAAQPTILSYERCILTEALAIHMMVVWLYCMVSYLEKRDWRFALAIGLLSGFMTLLRPSFLVLFPILFLFWGVRLVFEKRERRAALWGVCGILLSSILIVAYCLHNKKLTGQFMLSGVAYYNQLSILIENDIYENDEFTGITDSINQYIAETDSNSLAISVRIFTEYGYPDGVSYLRATMRKHYMEYAGCQVREWIKYQDEFLGRADRLSNGRLLNAVQIMLLPLSFRVILIICFEELLTGLIVWWRKRRIRYLSMVLSALCIAVMILSFGTLTFASPQRICFHMIPIVIVMAAAIIERILGSGRWRRKGSPSV